MIIDFTFSYFFYWNQQSEIVWWQLFANNKKNPFMFYGVSLTPEAVCSVLCICKMPSRLSDIPSF